MKRFKDALAQLFFVILFLTGAIIFFGCDADSGTGLGEALDLVPPKLFISTPQSGEFVQTTFKLEGTAFDEGKGIKSITIEQLSKTGAFVEIARAAINGRSWSAELKFEDDPSSDSRTELDISSLDVDGKVEGTKILRVTATDEAGNVGAASVKQVLVFVDKTPPTGNAWKIDRKVNGIYYPLKDITELPGIAEKLGLLENIDAAQNVDFNIQGTMSDAMGVNYVNIILKEFDLNSDGTIKMNGDSPAYKSTLGEVTSNKLEKTNDSNYYTPVFEIKHDDLVKMDPSLASGMHFIEVRYYAEDVVTEPHPNTTSEDGISVGSFIWWPESDNPHIEIVDNSTLQKDANNKPIFDGKGRATATYNVKSTFQLNVFDDDELDIVYSALLSDREYDELPKLTTVPPDYPYDNTNLDWDKIIDGIDNMSYEGNERPGDARIFQKITPKKGVRNKDFTFSTGDSPATKHLVLYAMGGGDTFLSTPDGDVIVAKNTRDLTVNIIDSNKPIIVVSTPQTNTVPQVEMSNSNTEAHFTISGQVMDTREVSSVDFVWVPDSVTADMDEKKTMALKWLLGEDGFVNNHINETLSSGTGAGMKMWSCKQVSPNSGCTLSAPVDDGSAFRKQEFSIAMDLLKDFGGDTAASASKEKFFCILATRDHTAGEELITTTGEYMLAGDDTDPIIVVMSPSSDGVSIEAGDGLDIEFYAYKANGIYVDPATLEVGLVNKSKRQVAITPYITGAAATGTQSIGGNTYTSHKYSVSGAKVGYNDDPDKATAGTLMGDGGAFPTFWFKARDILGKTSQTTRYITFNGKPMLQSIQSSDSNGKTFGIGQEITFSALFSSPPSINGVVSNLRLKLSGITGGDDFATASGISGNSIIFKYTIKEGETCFGSGGVQVVNTLNTTGDITSGTPFVAAACATVDDILKSALYNTVKNSNIVTNAANSKKKTFYIDGVRPKIKSVAISGTGKVSGGTNYCKAGTSVKAVITLDKISYVSGNPTIALYSGATAYNLTYQKAQRLVASNTTEITFERKVASGDPQGALTFNKGTALAERSLDLIKDKVNNTAGWQASITGGTSNITIDTTPPPSPAITYTKNSAAFTPNKKSNMSKDTISFSVTGDGSSTLEYSTDGGSTWTAGASGSLSSDGTYEVTARQTDIAGNVSAFAPSFPFEIVKNFPDFEIVCNTGDGDYGVGQTIKLVASFARPVTGDSAGCSLTIGTGKKALPLTGTTISNNKSISFQYTVKEGDNFTVGVSSGGVTLTGLHDAYGNTWASSNQKTLTTSVNCDGSSPTITNITHTAGRDPVVTITFNKKNIKKGSSGSIILRQRGDPSKTSGAGSVWVLPSVLSVLEFNTIYNNSGTLKSNIIVRDEGGSDILDEETDSNDAGNTKWHGSGQGVGPYVKTTHGINSDGTPDITTKYVLRFDFDPAANSDTKISCKKTVGTFSGREISVNDLRAAFEAAHYNERTIDVTNSSVLLDSSGTVATATVTFPASLLGEADLEAGRYWEVAVSKGAFIDSVGNEFGKGSSESIIAFPNKTFQSAGVDKPVIRVERFSYGLGVSDGGVSSPYIKGNTENTPGGKVRVRIETQSIGAAITYTQGTLINKSESQATNSETVIDKWDANRNLTFHTSGTASGGSAPVSPTSAATSYSGVFSITAFSGAPQASKVIIAAKAGSSALSYEGVFGTVMLFKSPHGTPLTSSIHGSTKKESSGEPPQIAGFPLRDQKIGTPFVRRCWKSSTNFYWYTYEIVCPASAAIRKSDWGRVAGPVYPGEFTYCTDAWSWDDK